MKKEYKEGKRKNWNLGLTKEIDKRLYISGRKISKSLRERRNILGYTHTEESKKKISITMIKIGRKPPLRTGIPSHRYGKTKENCESLKRSSDSMRKYYLNHPEEYKEKLKKLQEARKSVILPLKDTSIEIKIQNYLKQLGIDFFTHQYIKEIEHGYQCDILIPSMNMVIECDGNYWHKYPIGRDIDHIRTKELIEKGFKVLRLWEYDIKNMDINKFKERIENINFQENKLIISI